MTPITSSYLYMCAWPMDGRSHSFKILYSWDSHCRYIVSLTTVCVRLQMTVNTLDLIYVKFKHGETYLPGNWINHMVLLNIEKTNQIINLPFLVLIHYHTLSCESRCLHLFFLFIVTIVFVNVIFGVQLYKYCLLTLYCSEVCLSVFFVRVQYLVRFWWYSFLFSLLLCFIQLHFSTNVVQ